MKEENNSEVKRYHTLHQAMVAFGNMAGGLLADETAYLAQNPSVSDETETACFNAMETTALTLEPTVRRLLPAQAETAA